MPAPLLFGIRIPVGRTGRPQLSPSVHRDAAVAQARRLTALADILGLDYVFSGGDAGLSSETTLALLGAAKRLTVVAPISVAAWHPALLARFGAVAGRLSGGRFAIDLRSGPHPDDRRAEEFARIVRGLWAGDSVDVEGEHFRVRGLRPSVQPEVAPEIVVSGGWRAAASLAARTGDWFLHPGLDPQEVPARLAAFDGEAAATGRDVGFAVAAAVTFRPASGEAPTGIHGTPEEVAERLAEYGRSGVGLVVLDLADPEADLPVFAREVLPRVRELEHARALAAVH
ncbi:LLM class flavin-dependent oxidoreductase [Cryptosporangium minutisporangium]|uniref:Dimethyl sulfone monooxygenase SfnG n=1 Tax=Cryptosporangium minutisporangium TaxID=113569 RepID=A0ABP6SPC6_9ACTN